MHNILSIWCTSRQDSHALSWQCCVTKWKLILQAWWCSGTKNHPLPPLQGASVVILSSSGMWNQGTTAWYNVVWLFGPEDCSYQLQQHSSQVAECGWRASAALIPKSVSHPNTGSLICLTPAFFQQRSVLMMKAEPCHSVDLTLMQKYRHCFTHAQRKSAAPPPPPVRPNRALTVYHNKRPGRTSSALAQFPPQHLALGTAPLRWKELNSARGILSLHSADSQPLSACFMLQKVSICHGSMLLETKGRKKSIWNLLHTYRSICPRCSVGCCEDERDRKGERELRSVILDCRRWRINSIGLLFVICLSRQHSCFPSPLPPGFFFPPQ